MDEALAIAVAVGFELVPAAGSDGTGVVLAEDLRDAFCISIFLRRVLSRSLMLSITAPKSADLFT